MRSVGFILLALLLSAPLTAQESQVGADSRRERDDLAKDCSISTVHTCAVDLATDDPFHVAFGSLAPQSGFGLGGAYVEHFTPEGGSWKYSWNVDAVATGSGSWRGGAYLKIVRDAAPTIRVVQPGDAPVARARDAYPIVNVYVQSSSLDRLLFFGEGARSPAAGQSVFKERQTVLGTTVVYPLPGAPLDTSLLGGVNGRFVRATGTSVAGTPSIDQLYTTTTAPGLNVDGTFAQFQAGIRLKPHWLGPHVNTNYVALLDQFVSNSAAHGSFHRWTLDLQHTIPLFRDVVRSNETNGPDDCRPGLDRTDRCPRISLSRNRWGAIGFRAFATSSVASAGDAVPFYFQPTLGGSDLNGNMALATYQDYRFRAPNLLALQESVEHSVWGPLGMYFLAEQGNVADRAGDLNFATLLHSWAIGVTVRAGGFPLVNLSFAFGSPEGHHIIKTVDPSLLGSGGRPSLF